MANQSRISNSQRRMAASLLKCGTRKVWMDPAKAEKIGQAITRGDVRRLIGEGAIKKHRNKAKHAKEEKSKQRMGSRKGSRQTRAGAKEGWLKAVRPQRKLLKELKPKLPPKQYRKLYMMIKGGSFRSKAHMMLYLKERKLVSEK